MTKPDYVERMARGTIQMVTKRFVQPRFIRHRRTISAIAPDWKMMVNECDDGVMKCIRIQQLGIGRAYEGGRLLFVGNHVVASKAQGSEISQRFVRIAEGDGLQPVAQAIGLDEEEEWTVEDAHDTHRGERGAPLGTQELCELII